MHESPNINRDSFENSEQIAFAARKMLAKALEQRGIITGEDAMDGWLYLEILEDEGENSTIFERVREAIAEVQERNLDVEFDFDLQVTHTISIKYIDSAQK